MTADGKVVRVNSRRMSAGDTFNYQPPHTGVKIAALAVCIMLVLGFSAFTYATPAGSVSLDVNPSITYTVNIFDRVLTVTAVNDDGQNIINEIDLKNLSHKTISQAIETTITQLIAEGYITSDAETNGAVITASGLSEKKAQKLAEKLGAVAQERCEEQNCELNVECNGVGRERVEEAKALNTTPGKLNLVEKLQESLPEGEDIDVNEWLNKPVKEIMKAIKENNGNGSGNGNKGQDDENSQNNVSSEENAGNDDMGYDDTGNDDKNPNSNKDKNKDNNNGKGIGRNNAQKDIFENDEEELEEEPEDESEEEDPEEINTNNNGKGNNGKGNNGNKGNKN
jgi:hypothetical protein